MRKVLALAALVAAATATPSYAAMCVGSTGTARVCVNREVVVTPTGGPVAYSDCVVVGDPSTCYPVDVSSPNAAVTGSGSVVTTDCAQCPTPNELQDLALDCARGAAAWAIDEATGDDEPGSPVDDCV